ncbi:MAG: hypothetical protein KF718_16075 [Polyangiaceae bacterium]|nr:hypothetical protein [Polyangiaceae bacterium]
MVERPPKGLLAQVGLGATLLLATLAAAVPAGCLEQRAKPAGEDLRRCATCHGDPDRPGDALARAAPPADLSGATESSHPGVGAHAIHLNAGVNHAAIACSECHLVPARTDSPGHADTELPAELVFGSLAAKDGRQPHYDFSARRCTDSYCHGPSGAGAVWTAPRSTEDACGTCHGLPPSPPHPQSTRCVACHSEVVDAAGKIIAPEKHVDGIVQANDGGCTQCHGSGDDPAPPKDTLGNEAVTAIGVGAHQAHLAGGAFSRPVACGECHVVPASSASEGHANGVAEVSFTGIAATGGRTPTWERDEVRCADSHCHGPSPASLAPSPLWTTAGPLGCTSCHGAPPPPPHPQMTDCARCHAEVVGPDNVTIIDRLKHVDGVVNVSMNESCTSCHGSTNPAPPLDLAGNSGTTSPGVGAHQVHVLGTSSSRPVPCGECHLVPQTVLSSGHVDTFGPAEVLFSGAATAHGAAPVYAAGSCQSTACHGAVTRNGFPSGGSLTAPSWTTVDGTQAACGSCHGLPPPPPHPLPTNCSACHENILPNLTFSRPDLHIDGTVTFTVP